MKKILHLISSTGNRITHSVTQLFSRRRIPSLSLGGHYRRSRFPKWLVLPILGALILYLISAFVFVFYIYNPKNTNKYDSKTVSTLFHFYPLPAAMVKRHFIPASHVFQRIRYSTRFSEQTGQKVDSKDVLLKRAIDQEYEDVLVSEQLAKLNISVSQKDIDQVFKNDIADKNGGEAEVKKVLDTLYGMSVDEFKQLIAVQIRKDKLQEKGIQRVRVRHILVADENQAKSLIADITQGKRKFEDAAKEFSKDSNSKDSGGKIESKDQATGNGIDKISRGFMPPAFDEVVFDKAEPGKVYPEPVKTDFGFHVILVEERTGSIKVNFQTWLDQAKKDAKIKVYLK
jgi:parvulin-like peptidyl-prolyl isomerase